MTTHRVIFVIVYDHHKDELRWLTPAESARLCAAVPTCEQIGELHPCWPELSQRAGPMPEAYAREVDAPGTDG